MLQSSVDEDFTVSSSFIVFSIRSGLCDVRRLLDEDVKVGLGTGDTSIWKFKIKNKNILDV